MTITTTPLTWRSTSSLPVIALPGLIILVCIYIITWRHRQSECKPSTESPKSKIPSDKWFFPAEIADDMKGVGLPQDTIDETLTCAWEYTRSIIPDWTNWERYIAFTRFVAICTVAEFRGDLVRVEHGDKMLGYDLQEIFDILFKGTAIYEAMCREGRAYLLITSAKTGSGRFRSELFRRYVNTIAHNPRDWFRLRDCDGLIRFTIAAGLGCNDIEDVWFSEDECQILAEICGILYDAVAFYKHRAEGETNNTFAYVDPALRCEAFRVAREVLWAMDAVCAQKPAFRIAFNLIRFFGGPIHMTMRRYRFVEEQLRIGAPENYHIVKQARANFKLWNRIDAVQSIIPDWDNTSYLAALKGEARLLFEGLGDMLRNNSALTCDRCRGAVIGATRLHQFGGVDLCKSCRDNWNAYVESLPDRAMATFPAVRTKLQPSDHLMQDR